MKNFLLAFALVLLPFLSFAQDDAVVYPDFAQKIKELKAFRLNADINIMAINADNETFDVIAIDKNLNTVWRTSINGYVMAIAKFKGKIIAIAATDYSAIKGKNNTYDATLIDPKTGVKVVEKTIFESSPDYMIFPEMLIDQNEFFGLGIRQSFFQRRARIGLFPFALFALSKYEKQYRGTQDMSIIRFDDKLNEVSKIKPFFDQNGICLDWAVNNKGDVYIEWFIDNAINIYRYENGKDKPTIAKLDMFFPDGSFDSITPKVHFAVSEINRNVINCALFFLNDDNKSTLWVGNADLATGKKNSITEVFNSDHRKEIEKAFVKPDKKINSPDIGNLKGLTIKFFNEVNGILTVAVVSVSSETNYGNFYNTDYNIVINAYDASLGMKFQQLFPAKSTARNTAFPSSFYVQNNKMLVTAADGNSTIYALYGSLDLSTGQWDKIYRLSKKKIDSKTYPNGPVALWFNNSFYLPYMTIRAFSTDKYDVLMQQNTY